MSQKPLPSFGTSIDKFAFGAGPEKNTNSDKCLSTPISKNTMLSPDSKSRLKLKARKPYSTGDDTRKDNLNPLDIPKRKKKKYVGPEAYMHLDPLVPLLKPGLVCVFVGFNPGIETAKKGHYYAHPSNGFWKMIYQSGCVDRKVTFMDDVNLPTEYQYGFHDLVARPTRGIDELSGEEMLAESPRLEADLAEVQPKIVCFVGKGIWEKIYYSKTGKPLKQKSFEWGLQYRPRDVKDSIKAQDYKFTSKYGKTVVPDLPFTFAGGKITIYVLPSTSGIATLPSPKVRLDLWESLAEEIAFQRTFAE